MYNSARSSLFCLSLHIITTQTLLWHQRKTLAPSSEDHKSGSPPRGDVHRAVWVGGMELFSLLNVSPLSIIGTLASVSSDIGRSAFFYALWKKAQHNSVHNCNIIYSVAYLESLGAR